MPNYLTGADAFFAARERKGRLIVRSIVILNAILTIAGFIGLLLAGGGSFSAFLATLFWLFVYVCLYMGRSWAKWLFVVASALSGINMLVMITQMPAIESAPGTIVFALAVSISGVAVMVASSLLLLFSSAVKDFLYGQETS